MRITPAEQDHAAVDDLDAALRELQIPFDRAADEIALRAGRDATIAIHPMVVASASSVAALLAATPLSRQVELLVADRISGFARAALDAAGWSWLDRRGELALRVGDNYLVRTRVAPRVSARAQARPRGPIRSRAGLAYLAAALERPDEVPVLRAVARRAGLSHVALSNARVMLTELGLLDDVGRPMQPSSFEALAESWTPEVFAVATLPRPDQDELFGLGLDRSTEPGWALTDTLAAIAWGAPITVNADYPPDFHVPTRRELDRALHVLGRVDDFTTRAATIAIAPVPFATDRRFELPGSEWLVTHPLYAALAVARDMARGPELLAAWTPSGPQDFRPSW